MAAANGGAAPLPLPPASPSRRRCRRCRHPSPAGSPTTGPGRATPRTLSLGRGVGDTATALDTPPPHHTEEWAAALAAASVVTPPGGRGGVAPTPPWLSQSPEKSLPTQLQLLSPPPAFDSGRRASPTPTTATPWSPRRHIPGDDRLGRFSRRRRGGRGPREAPLKTAAAPLLAGLIALMAVGGGQAAVTAAAHRCRQISWSPSRRRG